MGKMFNNIDDVCKETNRRYRARIYHPQLKDDIKQELLHDRKVKSKSRIKTRQQQRLIKQQGVYNDEQGQ